MTRLRYCALGILHGNGAAFLFFRGKEDAVKVERPKMESHFKPLPMASFVCCCSCRRAQVEHKYSIRIVFLSTSTTNMYPSTVNTYIYYVWTRIRARRAHSIAVHTLRKIQFLFLELFRDCGKICRAQSSRINFKRASQV